MQYNYPPYQFVWIVLKLMETKDIITRITYRMARSIELLTVNVCWVWFFTWSASYFKSCLAYMCNTVLEGYISTTIKVSSHGNSSETLLHEMGKTPAFAVDVETYNTVTYYYIAASGI
jgi:hypothetical protein